MRRLAASPRTPEAQYLYLAIGFPGEFGQFEQWQATKEPRLVSAKCALGSETGIGIEDPFQGIGIEDAHVALFDFDDAVFGEAGECAADGLEF